MHDLDHFACSFHAIHPYLIYVIECIRIDDQGRFSYKDSDKCHLGSMLMQEMDQIELKRNSIIKIMCLCALKVYLVQLYHECKHSPSGILLDIFK